MFDLSKFTGPVTGSTGYATLPEDRYTLQVEKAEYIEAKNKPGSYYISTTLNITEGEFKNRKIWHNFSTSEKAIKFIINVLGHSGGSKFFGKTDISGPELAGELVGRVFSAMSQTTSQPNGKVSTGIDALTIAPAQTAQEAAQPAPLAKPGRSSTDLSDIFA